MPGGFKRQTAKGSREVARCIERPLLPVSARARNLASPLSGSAIFPRKRPSSAHQAILGQHAGQVGRDVYRSTRACNEALISGNAEAELVSVEFDHN